MRSYLDRHGKPVALCSDPARLFRAIGYEARKDGCLTQFSRALSELNIVCAIGADRKNKPRILSARQYRIGWIGSRRLVRLGGGSAKVW
jgi:hypothetical protein